MNIQMPQAAMLNILGGNDCAEHHPSYRHLPSGNFAVMDQELKEESKECSCSAQILIVDDNMFNLIPLELILKEMFGLTVDKAFNGQEAVMMFDKSMCKTCCEHKYKLILMDLNMPIMDGYEATQQIL